MKKILIAEFLSNKKGIDYMKFLITGGAGFIGGHLTEALISAGHSVIVIDNLSTGSLDNLRDVQNSNNFSFIEDDILYSDKLNEIIEKVDFIYHLAAAVGVELVVNDPIRTIETNVHGTEKVLKIAAKLNKKIIIASTSEVYGKSNKSSFSENDDLLIGPSTHSRWSYACSKLLDEFFAMAYFRSNKTQVTITRFFNTVGPRQTGRYGMVIPRFVSSAVKNKTISVYGDGSQTRCFCHVFDTVRALIKLSEEDNIAGKIFNIGGTYEISILDLAKKVIELSNSKSDIKFIPYSEAYEEGFEDMMRRVPNVDLIKSKIGWNADLSLDEIIKDVVNSSE